MVEKKDKNLKKIDKNDEFKKARLGYQTGIKLISLVSEEIYSRFIAMLTANSIILAIIGWILISENEINSPILFILTVIGLALCFLWYLFNYHGVYWQRLFRKEAIRLEEKYFTDTFKLISLVETEDPSKKQPKYVKNKIIKMFSYERISNYVIFIFSLIYSGIIIFQIVPFILSYFDL